MTTAHKRSATFASAHIVFSTDDLAVFERRLGPCHPITIRVRLALADLADPYLCEYRAAAQAHHREGELEIDPGAVVSKGDDPGAYVMAWLWIDDTELASPRPKASPSRRARRARPQNRPATITASSD
jgi:hypothetical protein